MTSSHVAGLTSKVTALRSQASEMQKRLNRERKDIESNPTLSDVGRKQYIDELRSTVQTNLKALRAQEDREIRETKTFLERLAFGTIKSGDIVGFRDAQDRAERLQDSKAAEELLARAARVGDSNLADAIVRVAAERGYRSVIKAYAVENPKAAEYVQGIADIQDFEAQSFERTLAYSAL